MDLKGSYSLVFLNVEFQYWHINVKETDEMLAFLQRFSEIASPRTSMHLNRLTRRK